MKKLNPNPLLFAFPLALSPFVLPVSAECLTMDDLSEGLRHSINGLAGQGKPTPDAYSERHIARQVQAAQYSGAIGVECSVPPITANPHRDRKVQILQALTYPQEAQHVYQRIGYPDMRDDIGPYYFGGIHLQIRGSQVVGFNVQ